LTDRLGVRRRFGPEAPRERLPRALVRASGRHPWRVLGGWLLLCLVAVPGIARLSIETSTRSLFDRLDPAWSVYQRSLDLFGGDETVVVAIDAPEPFDPRALRAVVRLGERLERLPGVRRLDSIATQPVIHVDAEGTLHLEAAAADFGDEGARDAAAVAERARGDRLLRRNVVSDDGRTLAINLVLDRDVFPHYEEILEAAHGGIARLEPPLVGRVSGVPVFQWETTSHTQGELLAFGPAALGTIGVLLWIVFRSLRGTVFLLVVGVVGLVDLALGFGLGGAVLGGGALASAPGLGDARHVLGQGIIGEGLAALRAGVLGVRVALATMGLGGAPDAVGEGLDQRHGQVGLLGHKRLG